MGFLSDFPILTNWINTQGSSTFSSLTFFSPKQGRQEAAIVSPPFSGKEGSFYWELVRIRHRVFFAVIKFHSTKKTGGGGGVR